MTDEINLKLGDYIYISNFTQDDDLTAWVENQTITEFRIHDIDYENGYIWIENCPYAIWFEDVRKVCK